MTTTENEEIVIVNDVEADEVARLEHDLAERISFRDTAIAEADAAEAALVDFKRKVVQVALDAKRRHNWCSTVDDAVEELDLEFPRLKFSGTVNFRVPFVVTDTDRVDGENSLPVGRVVQREVEGLETIAASIRSTLEMGGHYDGFAVTNVTFDVENLVRIPPEES